MNQQAHTFVTTPPGGSADGDVLDVAVVGAGQAGLAVGWYLQQQGVRFALLEAAPVVGHSWASRWDSLSLFTPAEYSSLPGMAFPTPAGSHPTKDEAATYLRAYASTFALPVRLDTPVTQLRRTDGIFSLQTPHGVVRARQVVVATGPFQTPFVPDLAGGLDESVTQVHSARYRNPSQLPSGSVLVVGSGNSGLQIAAELGRAVHVAAGATGAALPQRLLGRDLFWWLTRLGLITKSADSRLARRMRARGEMVIGSSRRRLERAGVVFHPRLTAANGRTVTFADGAELEVDAVVWATGYRPDYGWLGVRGVFDDGGRVRHQRGVTDVPGLCFVGLPWQHSRGSSLLGFVAEDAAFVTDHLAAVRVTTTRLG